MFGFCTLSETFLYDLHCCFASPIFRILIRVVCTPPSALTLRHLLTHTAGFETLNQHLFASGARSLGSLTQVLMDRAPARVRLPGELPAYSNYGAALAAQVVADVSNRT